jgi:hypothetical protein
MWQLLLSCHPTTSQLFVNGSGWWGIVGRTAGLLTCLQRACCLLSSDPRACSAAATSSLMLMAAACAHTNTPWGVWQMYGDVGGAGHTACCGVGLARARSGRVHPPLAAAPASACIAICRARCTAPSGLLRVSLPTLGWRRRAWPDLSQLPACRRQPPRARLAGAGAACIGSMCVAWCHRMSHF